MKNPLFGNSCPHVYRCSGFPKKCNDCKFYEKNDYFEPKEEVEEDE